MMDKYLTRALRIIQVSTLFFPMVALAAAPTTFKEAAMLVVGILKGIAELLFASLAVGLLFGVILYFVNADNESKREQIKGYLFWGVIGISVVFGMWGIVGILASTLGWGVGIPFISPPS